MSLRVGWPATGTHTNCSYLQKSVMIRWVEVCCNWDVNYPGESADVKAIWVLIKTSVLHWYLKRTSQWDEGLVLNFSRGR